MNCPTCGHPMSVHNDEHGWCLMPGCDCGKQDTFSVKLAMGRCLAGHWHVQATTDTKPPQTAAFIVQGETENEATFNAMRHLRSLWGINPA